LNQGKSEAVNAWLLPLLSLHALGTYTIENIALLATWLVLFRINQVEYCTNITTNAPMHSGFCDVST